MSERAGLWRQVEAAARVGALAALVGASVSLAGAPAHAYSTPALYPGDPVATGGAGGRAFTGSPADGYTCAVCHVGEAVATHRLVGGPQHGYDPGATYGFELRWPGERLGLTVEATDREGRPLGTLVTPPPSLLEDDERCASSGPAVEVLALEGGRTPLGLSECGATRLRLQWTAPEEPVEGALYLALVVADGEGTPEDDQTEVISVPLVPAGSAGEGCSIGVGGPPAAGGLVGIGLLVAGVVRRRRCREHLEHREHLEYREHRDHREHRAPRDRGAEERPPQAALAPFRDDARNRATRRKPRIGAASLVLLVALLAGACARVQPYERGRLARPDMQMSDGRDLEGGPEHAIDYREGSAGGLGGAAGGCGCN